MNSGLYTFLTGFLVVIFIVFAIWLLIQILYLLNLHKTLEEVSPHNRKMDPGMVWLFLIPLFGMIWHFIIVEKIANSLKDEFAERGIPVEEEKPGYQVGLACCILTACTIIPFLGALSSLGALITWIIYWVKTADYKNQLKRNQMHLL